MMKIKFNGRLLLILPIIYSSACLSAERKKIDIFEAPKQKEASPPRYPKAEAARSAEGWVLVNFMVAKDGSVFEPTVVDSAGSDKFINSTLKAIDKLSYEPATLNGEPVEGSANMRFTFIMKGQDEGASSGFVRRYRKFLQAMESIDKAEIDTTFAALGEKETLSHYENGFLDYAKYMYALKYESKEEALLYLRRALLMNSRFKDKVVALPDDLERVALRELFALEVDRKRYAEAVSVFEQWMERYPEDVKESYKQAYQQVLSVRDQKGAYSFDVATNESGYWSGELYKHGFYIEGDPQNLNELKLRCDKKYVFFAYEGGDQYQLPESWGDCRLEVLGGANAVFTLVQFTE